MLKTPKLDFVQLCKTQIKGIEYESQFNFHSNWPSPEEDSELPKVLLKVLFWALLKVLLLGKVLFKVLKKVLEIVQYPKKC